MQTPIKSVIPIAALIIGSMGLNLRAASDEQRLSRKDIESSSNIDVDTKSQPGGMTRFMIDVGLSADASPSRHLRGRLEVYDNEQLIVSGEVKNVHPAPLSKRRRRLGAEPRPIEFAFSMRDQYVEGSRFYLTYVYPESERTAIYWVELNDLLESP